MMWWPMACGRVHLGAGRRLHKLDLVAFGILHREPSAAVGAFGHRAGHLPAFGGEILAHALRVSTVLKAGMVHAIDARVGRQRQHLDELRGAERILHALGVFRDRPSSPRR